MSEQWICNGVEFFEGDRVRVMRLEEDLAEDGMGQGRMWYNAWIGTEQYWEGEEKDRPKHMDGYFDLDFTIDYIDNEGVHFECEDNELYSFPLTSLDNLSAAQRMKDAA